jgi:hypothetical protein
MLHIALMVAGCSALAAAAGASEPPADETSVFFMEDFESGDLEKWDPRGSDLNSPNLKLISDPARVLFGKYSLEITAPPGRNSGAKVTTWFLPGFDVVYARWYCMFAPDFEQGRGMHFVNLLGGTPGDIYAAMGKAGTRPTGRDFFNTGFEPWHGHGRHAIPGAMAFYSYHPEMKRSRDGRYWGTLFTTDPPFVIERGRWYCMEIMLKCNTPGRHDGEQAAWIDGEKVLHVKDIRWRDIPELKIHAFWLDLYVHDGLQVNRVYFDDVALGHSYIGLTDR